MDVSNSAEWLWGRECKVQIVEFLLPLTPIPVVFSRLRRLSADEMPPGRPVKPRTGYAIAKYLKQDNCTMTSFYYNYQNP